MADQELQRERDGKPSQSARAREWANPLVGDAPAPTRAERGRERAIPPASRARAAWRERDVERVAARQRGLITYAQLGELGISRSAICRAATRGRMHRVHEGVYAIAALELLPPLAREQAALLACGSGSAISHRSAAAVWGMDVAKPEEVEVIVVGHDRGRRRRGIRVHRVAELAHGHVRRHQHLLVTSPARTLLDLGAVLDDRELERSLDDAIARRIVSRAALREVLIAYARQRGSRRLRRLADESTTIRSTGEKELLRLIRRAQLPPPETNARFERFEVDFLWRAERVAVELDGYGFHSSRAALERDHRKDMALQAAGFTVIRVSGRQLAQTPEMVVAWIAAALARSGAIAA